VHVDRFSRAREDGIGLVLFLDVRVETVVHHLAGRMIHGADEMNGLGGGGQEVALETVQRLDGELDSPGLCLLGGAPQGVHSVLEFFLRRSRAGEDADR
jgi:hypothetical protein